MSIQDLRHAIARHIASAIPGRTQEEYMRAAIAASSMWPRDEYRAGYRKGKEAGLAESSHGGEIAMLRERIKRLENQI
jgi:hypothetical protein